MKDLGLKFVESLPAVGSVGEGTGNQGLGFEILGVVLYLRDCNNNHTSATGLVASIILSTVDQKCMGVKTILVWLCVDVCAFCELQNKPGVGSKFECTEVESAGTFVQQWPRSSTER